MLLCQFSVLAGNRFWFYILLTYLEYHTGVVLCYFFLIWQEIVFGTYVLSVQYSCAVVSIFIDYFYHGSDLSNIIRFLREIECIKFECNEFVLVLVQIDLIHFEHPIIIRST